jgi:hypothetical protein
MRMKGLVLKARVKIYFTVTLVVFALALALYSLAHLKDISCRACHKYKLLYIVH